MVCGRWCVGGGVWEAGNKTKINVHFSVAMTMAKG